MKKVSVKVDNKILCKSAEYIDSGIKLGTGLMFKKQPKSIVLDFGKERLKTAGLTMAFVFFPIDAVFVNEKMEVSDIKRNFQPWKHYTPKRMSRYAIEVPAGNAKDVKIGDKVSFEKEI